MPDKGPPKAKGQKVSKATSKDINYNTIKFGMYIQIPQGMMLDNCADPDLSSRTAIDSRFHPEMNET